MVQKYSKIDSDLELLLLTSENKRFPLKKECWELNFGLENNKAIVGTEYTQEITLANTNETDCSFEFYVPSSNKYRIRVGPRRMKIPSENAIKVLFTVKFLCTTSVCDSICIISIVNGIVQTTTFKLIIESDLSTRIDYNELESESLIGE